MKGNSMNKISCAVVVSVATVRQSIAFTNPLHQVVSIPCRHQRRFLLFDQIIKTPDSAFGSLSENETISRDGEEVEVIKTAALLTSAIEEAEEEPFAETKPVFTTSEEAAIALAAAPVTPQEGAYVAEESALSGEGLFWRGVVVVLCALWASNFACTKVVLAQDVDASTFAVARFSIAALSLLPGSINSIRKGNMSWETARGAIACGAWVAFGYMGQLIGLLDTTPSRSCVICSLNCIFVAIVAEFMRLNSAKSRGYTSQFDLKKLVPAMIAVMGVAIIELKGAGGSPTRGDLISFAQPIGFGMGYLQLEELMHKQPSAALPVSAMKLGVVSLAALAFFEATHMVGGAAPGLATPDFSPILNSPSAMLATFYTGIVTTSLALWVESIAFQRVPATDASVILTTEPLFAAATSAVLVGEQFGLSDAVGAFFIVGACIYAIKQGDAQEICDDETMECVVSD
ncbi:hypothetical protein ACHAWO_011024 [Cyclotella atomus]|uniref:EamA domain-containing protein n=1 Tax=Cyclotella atomus TaxID=382360 RepID=A0ABD3P4C3_9STRA